MGILNRQKNDLPLMLSGVPAALLLMVILLIAGVILAYGVSYFWPQPLYEVRYEQGGTTQSVFAKVQSRDYRSSEEHSHWVMSGALLEQFGAQQYIVESRRIIDARRPPELTDILLRNGNRLYAKLLAGYQGPQRLSVEQLPELLNKVSARVRQVEDLKQDQLGPIHQQLAQMERRGVAQEAPARQKLAQRFAELQEQIQRKERALAEFRLSLMGADGREFSLPLASVDDYWLLNRLDVLDKFQVFLTRLWHFVSEGPKSSNDTGGVFPALFGTVVMVLLMTVLVTPLGVIAALYLSEYAPDNGLTSLIRIGVNNLAGVPSIVYGVFGLGFWVYIVGGQIDEWLFSDHLPAPTFGAPGLFWASLTMAMLTLPVVIVATEEGLRRVPKSLRHGSFALGATKFETIWNTVLPMASPGIMTGMILAIARGAGEVAPLLLVGAVKFAPSLPVDGEFPYLHLDRQFMHLGVLIYDGAFHSNHFAQSGSMMFATCLLLLLIVVVLNVAAILVRARLRARYQALIR
ncbi:Phosphate transport system permease protein PstA [Saliniradius amylolyticus]|uniref:Phosphate transport system permease protein PstA n=1 Tax=Saliniradius amylolyticus TaxID=2183582 RepID=A0A2S2E173_9ALTE|nr:phosphate ABC transporter permease PstA [Saliniradius amylolyticus]AWL11272.1 Phosphate transport system permease protein PstA [Saliniradius amylolyticus]